MAQTKGNEEVMLKLEALMNAIKEKKPDDYGARIAELEVKMAKLWALIVTTTPGGQDKVKREAKTLFQQLKEAQK